MKKMFLFALVTLAAVGWSDEDFDESAFIPIECTYTPIVHKRIQKHPRSFAAANPQATSTNWSGYVSAPSFTTSDAGSVTYVAGSWVVPALLPTPDTTYCAVWIGIDGVLDVTVEQIGTSHDWVSGAQQNYAWFEMFPNGAYELTGFPVDIGDQISARVGYKGDNVFKMVIFNHTKGVSAEVPAVYTTMANTQRSCAEWVVEAPYSGGVLPLSDFHLATFNYCSAIINGVNGAINDSHWLNESMTMEGNSGVKALPSSLLKNGNCFTVSWKHE